VDEIFLLKILSFVVEITTFLSERGSEQTAKTVEMTREDFVEKKILDEYAEKQQLEKKRTSSGDDDRMIYCEWMQINAMVIYVSFLSTPWREKSVGADTNAVELMVHYLGSFSNLESAPIKLNALILQRPFCPKGSLQNTIVQHYVRQALSEWYKVSTFS
jgi:hypothetical protein